jgi:triosephosphate isomerase
MNLRRDEAMALLRSIAGSVPGGCTLWIFPSFTLLPVVSASSDVANAGAATLTFGGQDLSPEAEGAFTGDVSAEMLTDAGAKLVLVGHSERRQGHGESDALLQRKLKRAVQGGLRPLLCVGETLAQRKAGDAQAVVARQLQVLQRLTGAERQAVCAVAYEPVWAIGTGENATAAQASEMHALVRGELKAMGLKVPVLYGGSVRADNAAELMAAPGIDGVLVGGASLNAESLRAICEAGAAST